jgi:hypothetical protein
VTFPTIPDEDVIRRLQGLESKDTLILQSIDRLVKSINDYNEIQRNRTLYPIVLAEGSSLPSGFPASGPEWVTDTDLRIEWVLGSCTTGTLALVVSGASIVVLTPNITHPVPMFVRAGQNITFTDFAMSDPAWWAVIWAWRQ